MSPAYPLVWLGSHHSDAVPIMGVPNSQRRDRSHMSARLRTFLVGVVIFVLALSGCGGATSTQGTSASSTAESPSELNPDIKHKIDDALQQAMTAASVPGVMLGIWGPNGHYERAYGVADKATGAPMETS